MTKALTPNPPSDDFMKKSVEDAGTSATFNTTQEVRGAISRAIQNGHWPELSKYLYGGKVTGSIQADQYELARDLVKRDAEAHHTALDSALESGNIRLVDIVKRLAPELRKLKADVRRGVCVGSTQPKVSGLDAA